MNVVDVIIGLSRTVEDAKWMDSLYDAYSSNGCTFYQNIYKDLAELPGAEFMAKYGPFYTYRVESIEAHYTRTRIEYTRFAEAKEKLDKLRELFKEVSP